MISARDPTDISHYSYLKFSAQQSIDCLGFYRFTRDFFSTEMDIVFDRQQADKRYAVIGYLRLPYGIKTPDKFYFKGVRISLKTLSQDKFKMCPKSIPEKVYFKGFTKTASIQDIKAFFNKYGKIRSLTQFEMIKGVGGEIEHQGCVAYWTPIDAERLLSKGPYQKHYGRNVLIDSYTKKEAKNSSIYKNNYIKQVYHFKSDMSESEESYNCGNDRTPNL